MKFTDVRFVLYLSMQANGNAFFDNLKKATRGHFLSDYFAQQECLRSLQECCSSISLKGRGVKLIEKEKLLIIFTNDVIDKQHILVT